MSHPIYVKLWGVRGSHPVSGKETIEYGGNTPCVQVEANGQLIILDAGTGIIGLGRYLAARGARSSTPVEATLLFSHYHHDHIEGFRFFLPAYFPSTRLHLYGPRLGGHDVESALACTQAPPLFPVALGEMRAVRDTHIIQDGETLLLRDGAIMIHTQRSYAHPGGVLMYRIEYNGLAVVYATDTEGYLGTDRRLVSFAQGADLMIHDAQYTEEHYRGTRAGYPATQGFGHSTAVMACEVAAAAGVQHLVLFHHDPSYNDDLIRITEAQIRSVYPNVTAAYEGLEITIEGDQTATVAVPNKNGVAAAV